ncbi:MAG TPA: alpha/beta hydrolase, partial [Terriglobales bacterium]|nr:alpha/beta hydrolase [Terriglobales bacterium]
MLTRKTFRGSAVSLNYMEGPAGGPALLLLHGLTQRWQAFLQLLPQLTQTHHVFVPDLRGHGESGHMKGGYRGEGYGQDILEFLDQVVKEPVIIFGHSLGGLVGIWVSGYRKEQVRALIVGDSKLFLRDLNGSMYGEMFGKTLALLRESREFEFLRRGVSEMLLHSPVYGEVPMKMLPVCDEAYIAAWARSLSHMDPETIEMTLDGRAAENWRPEEYLPKVKCPTLLLQADPKMGGLMTDEDVRRARTLFPD